MEDIIKKIENKLDVKIELLNGKIPSFVGYCKIFKNNLYIIKKDYKKDFIQFLCHKIYIRFDKVYFHSYPSPLWMHIADINNIIFASNDYNKIEKKMKILCILK